MARLDAAMAVYPKMFFRVNTGIISVTGAHGGHDHDVDGRVRVDPEHVLEENGVAALGRIKEAHTEEPFYDDKHEA